MYFVALLTMAHMCAVGTEKVRASGPTFLSIAAVKTAFFHITGQKHAMMKASVKSQVAHGPISILQYCVGVDIMDFTITLNFLHLLVVNANSPKATSFLQLHLGLHSTPTIQGQTSPTVSLLGLTFPVPLGLEFLKEILNRDRFHLNLCCFPKVHRQKVRIHQ